MENILVIGIAGGTGSGKTTLMKNLISRFQGDVTVLSHDNYYKRHDELTYEDGAQVACGFGTCYEALMKIGISGNDRVLVTGLGPVGLATLMLAKAMGCDMTIGTDVNEERMQLARDLGLADYVFNSADPEACQAKIMEVTQGYGCERAIDCSANNSARAMAIRCTREWGKMAMVGEGNDVTFNPSPDIMHGQKSIYGSWVTSLWRMEELVEHLVRWGIHPDKLITHRFELKDVAEAYINYMLSVDGGDETLYLRDGKTLQLQPGMTGVGCFMKCAFAGWLEQTGRKLEDCDFYDPDNSCWFPPMGEVQ